MNYWHMQLHQGGSSPLNNEDIFSILDNHAIIGMSSSWENDNGQPERFKSTVSIGDVVLIRANNSPLALVEIVGECEKNTIDDVWFEISRKIKILVIDKENFIKEKYNKDTNKNWTDGIYAATTFQTANDYEFLKYWLKEYFEKNIIVYQKLQTKFTSLFTNESALFAEVNSIPEYKLQNIYSTYTERGDVSDQPVVLLRKTIVEELLLGNRINSKFLKEKKEALALNFEKNVYHSWTKPFRILYSLFYEEFKNELVHFFSLLSRSIQKDLNLVDSTKVKLVHFDGAQNQGSVVIWFSIYNDTYQTQKLARQLLFVIRKGFEFGLYDEISKKRDKMVKTDDFNYDNLIEMFEEYKQTILEDNSMEKAQIANYLEVLEYKKQIILQGPPGTGKTYSAKKMAHQILKESYEERSIIIQFHPSYSYEDFVRGISAKSVGEKIVYQTENKILASFAQKASESDEPYVLIIDEINRANLSTVLGELIYALEYRNESVQSMYAINGDNSITIPENLYIIGTMNTADRSVGHIDYAIKRRFAFVDVLPNEVVIKHEKAKELFNKVSELFVTEKEGKRVNSDFLASDFDYKDVQLGHSYFILSDNSTGEEQKAELEMRLKYEILPILNDYVRDGLLLETAKENIKEIAKFEC